MRTKITYIWWAVESKNESLIHINDREHREKSKGHKKCDSRIVFSSNFSKFWTIVQSSLSLKLVDSFLVGIIQRSIVNLPVIVTRQRRITFGNPIQGVWKSKNGAVQFDEFPCYQLSSNKMKSGKMWESWMYWLDSIDVTVVNIFVCLANYCI